MGSKQNGKSPSKQKPVFTGDFPNMTPWNQLMPHHQGENPTWWLIPLSRWVTTLVINGISGGNVHLKLGWANPLTKWDEPPSRLSSSGARTALGKDAGHLFAQQGLLPKLKVIESAEANLRKAWEFSSTPRSCISCWISRMFQDLPAGNLR